MRSTKSQAGLEAMTVQSQLQSALMINWSQFDWARDCDPIHEGSMKVVGCLKSHPGIAVASVLRGTGESTILAEIESLNSLAAEGIRTIGYASQMIDVPHFDAGSEVKAKAYLLQYFSEEATFSYEEGEPDTEDYFVEPMLKLKILQEDEGDWLINKHTVRAVKDNDLEHEFMEDITAVVKMLVSKGVRIVDFQGVLGTDGHFYVADPLRLDPIDKKVNRHLLEGVFMSSTNPARENKPKRVAFVDALGVGLGVDVPDEE